MLTSRTSAPDEGLTGSNSVCECWFVPFFASGGTLSFTFRAATQVLSNQTYIRVLFEYLAGAARVSFHTVCLIFAPETRKPSRPLPSRAFHLESCHVTPRRTR